MCVCMLVTAGTASAGTIYVDDNAALDPGPGNPAVSDPDEDGSAGHPFDAIQEGIDAAILGEEVVILDGTYTGEGDRDLNFGGKAITVRSQSDDPATCVIDCQGTEEAPRRGFYFHSGETSASVLQGVTIIGGYVTADSPGGNCGGSVYCNHSGPTIHDCMIVNSCAAGLGGGFYCEYGSPELSSCSFTGNDAGLGGAIYCKYSDTTISDCTVTDCDARYGAGLNLYYGTHYIAGCLVRDNVASTSYGGMSCDFCNATIVDSTIQGNTVLPTSALTYGAGLHCYEATVLLARCDLSENTGANNGGGAACRQSDVTITDCTFGDNSAGHGGGVYSYDSTVSILECCLVGNSASTGGAVWCRESTTIDGCTIRENTAAFYGGGIYREGGGTTAIRGCEISGNSVTYSSAFTNQGGGVHCRNGDTTIADCTITRNTVPGTGGGVYVDYYATSVTISRCLIAGNEAVEFPGGGGGVYARTGTSITNCTITGNLGEGSYEGGGVSSHDDVVIDSSIIWGNVPTNLYAYAGTPTVTYSCAPGDWPGDGNISQNPQFGDIYGPDDLPGTEDDDLHLLPNSPCIDTGDPALVLTPGERDLDGHARVLRGRVDMGAYEFGIGDFDSDKQVDLADFDSWFACMTGPNAGPYAGGCEVFDFEFDEDVDLFDVAGFQQVFAGPQS